MERWGRPSQHTVNLARTWSLHTTSRPHRVSVLGAAGDERVRLLPLAAARLDGAGWGPGGPHLLGRRRVPTETGPSAVAWRSYSTASAFQMDYVKGQVVYSLDHYGIEEDEGQEG